MIASTPDPTSTTLTCEWEYLAATEVNPSVAEGGENHRDQPPGRSSVLRPVGTRDEQLRPLAANAPLGC